MYGCRVGLLLLLLPRCAGRIEPSNQRNLAIVLHSQPMVPGQNEATLQYNKLMPLNTVPPVNDQGGTPAGDDYHIWVPVETMESWQHLLLSEMIEPLLFFRYQLKHGRVDDSW